jgi:hypothetical protein
MQASSCRHAGTRTPFGAAADIASNAAAERAGAVSPPIMRSGEAGGAAVRTYRGADEHRGRQHEREAVVDERPLGVVRVVLPHVVERARQASACAARSLQPAAQRAGPARAPAVRSEAAAHAHL